ncbi:MAG: DUF2264 domain-containing protein, partial [Terracoccus sp.]
EAASVAIGLHETRELIWNSLSDPERQRVVEWLEGAVGVEYPGNNWVWFQNVVQAFLASVGGRTCAADVERNLARVEEWYTGDGWYTDGAFRLGEHRCYDHYSGWAMHFYPLWWCRMLGDTTDAALAQTYRSRLRRWLEQTQHLVGSDGAPLYHGRSLTYRHAVLAPFWVGAIHDATPLSPGRTRRLASGVLSYFEHHGAWDDRDLQPIGWHGEFTPIRQWYSGPGSPYWSSKGFAGLVLPGDHPVWTSVEEPLAVELTDVEVSFPAPGWLVSATTADGIVRVVNHGGGDHWPRDVLGLDETIYGRYAYSGAAAPDSGLVAETEPTDSSVVLLDAQGRASHRRPSERVQVSGRVGVSRHRPHWLLAPARDEWTREEDSRLDLFEVGHDEPWLTVGSALRGAIEIRVIRVDTDREPPVVRVSPRGDAATRSGPPAVRVARGPWHLRVGGYNLASTLEPQCTASDAVAASETNVVWSEVRGDGSRRSQLVGIGGEWQPGHVGTHGANALGTWAACPTLTTAGPVADGSLTAVAVVLTGSFDVTSRDLPTVEVDRDEAGAMVTVTWPDGEVDAFRLDPPPLPEIAS